VATSRDEARCRERLTRLSGSTLDCDSIRLEAVAQLQRVIGFDQWCWPLADPDSLIPLSGLADHAYGSAVPRALELEYSGDDVAAMDTFARGVSPTASLSAETGGDLARSRRWDEVLRSAGIGDEAVLACRDALGCWGWLKAYRDGGERPFVEQDLDLLALVGPVLGAALRRSLVRDGRRADAEPSPAGVILLDGELRPISSTAGARAWMDALPGASIYAAFGMLPAMVYPLASRARSTSDAKESRVLERTVDGRWVTIDAAALDGSGDATIAITFRQSTAGEVFDRLARLYAFTRRERQLVAALLAGLDTRALSERLCISRHTVQDHLKSVFEKSQARSRRELLARFSS
jgi:DNA-binding CsgD family transcriptional regulator